MLPVEQLMDIFRFTSRSDLESLMLASSAIRHIIIRSFSKEPLRDLYRLLILGTFRFEFVLVTENDNSGQQAEKIILTDVNEFRRRMNRCTLRELG